MCIFSLPYLGGPELYRKYHKCIHNFQHCQSSYISLASSVSACDRCLYFMQMHEKLCQRVFTCSSHFYSASLPIRSTVVSPCDRTFISVFAVFFIVPIVLAFCCYFSSIRGSGFTHSFCICHGLFGHTGGVCFSWPLNCTFFIFSDQLLNILLAMYLVSNKVASNPAKITVFLHLSYN